MNWQSAFLTIAVVSGSEKLTERQRKGQSLENLRKKRERKANARRSAFSGDDDEAKPRKKRTYNDSDSDVSNDYRFDDEEEEEEKARAIISYEEALSIQLTRDKAESWLYKPDFERAIKGCLARISLGNIGGGGSREPVYRCVYIAGIFSFHPVINLTGVAL